MARDEGVVSVDSGPASAGGGGDKASNNIPGENKFATFLNFLGRKNISAGWKRIRRTSDRRTRSRRVAELESNLALREVQTNALEKEIGQLRGQLDRSKETREGLEAQTKALRDEMDRLRLELDRSRQEKEYAVEEFRKENEVAEARRSALEEYESRLSLRDAQDNVFERELGQLRRQLDRSRHEKDSIAKEMREENAIVEAQRSALEEYESRLSLQDARVSKLERELENLRRQLEQSQREKESIAKELREENAVVEAQRAALEDSLVELNKSAGSLREPSSPPGIRHGEAPAWAAQVAALREENEALRLSVDALRRSFAVVEEERRTVEERMDAGPSRRGSSMATMLPFPKTGGRGSKRYSVSLVAGPDKAAGGH